MQIIDAFDVNLQGKKETDELRKINKVLEIMEKDFVQVKTGLIWNSFSTQDVLVEISVSID